MNKIIVEKKQKAIRESMDNSKKWDEKIRLQRITAERQAKRIKELMANHCRRANSPDYESWLNGYLQKPNTKITHVYDYALPGSFYIAKNDFILSPGYGAYSVSIIVPVGINVTVEDQSHNQLYFMDGYVTDGGFVPLYKG